MKTTTALILWAIIHQTPMVVSKAHQTLNPALVPKTSLLRLMLWLAAPSMTQVKDNPPSGDRCPLSHQTN